WNPATHPTERMVPVVAVAVTIGAAAAVLALGQALRRRRAVPLLLPGALGLALAVLSALDPAGVWTRVVTDVPGGGLLRDAQKLVAPVVVVVAAGTGVLAVRLAARRPAGPAGAVLVAALPVLCLPSLAWGVGGRLAAVEVPADVRGAATQLSSAPPGAVGLLPWSQYRRYAWNGDRISLTLAPRMVDQRVLLDDGLPLASGRVAGEDPASARVTAAIEAGTDPVQALRDEGARYLLLERRVGAAGPGTDVAVPPGAVVLADTADSLVLDLDPAAAPAPTRLDAWGRAGWALSLATALGAATVAGHAAARAARSRRWGRATGW
ncbi:MAG TPA: hypothetical protein VFL46_12880, partial [Phycicoccus sp.]|nr:hypothetical protein [Phycicoccus sp.]